MVTSTQLTKFFSKPVIPVVGDVTRNTEVLASASSVILQGIAINDLAQVLDFFSRPPLDHLRLLAHIDLFPGLENNDAGLEYLAGLGRLDGVATVHQHLTRTAKRLGLLSIVRIFLSDSRALERGLGVCSKAKPDVVEFLPASGAVKVAEDLRDLSTPHIAGGLCRTEADIRDALESGAMAVTSTRPELWKLNERA